MDYITIDQIKYAVYKATKKHGPMPNDKFFQIVKATEELGEMAQIANILQEDDHMLRPDQRRELNEQYYLEILDTIAVLVRCLKALRG